MEPDDGLFLPLLQPEMSGNPAVVLVRLAVAFPPAFEPPGANLSFLRPTPDGSTIRPRVSCGTQTPVRVPRPFPTEPEQPLIHVARSLVLRFGKQVPEPVEAAFPRGTAIANPLLRQRQSFGIDPAGPD